MAFSKKPEGEQTQERQPQEFVTGQVAEVVPGEKPASEDDGKRLDVRLLIRFDKATVQKADKVARRKGLTRVGLIRMYVNDSLDREDV